jgi:ABC-type Fe3+-citrate transport system substrate-binding protein
MRLSNPSRSTFSAAAVTAALLALSACGSAGDSSGSNNGKLGNAKAAIGTNTSDVTLDTLKKQVDLSQCTSDSRTIKHDVGTTTIKGKPARVVALEYSFADAVAAAGLKPVGIADDNKPKRIEGLKQNITGYKSVGLRASPSLPTISSLKPDLIIADTTRNKAIISQLQGIAPTISLTSVGAGYGATLATDLQISAALGRCDTMEAALTDHFARMKQIAAQIPPGEHRSVIFADVDPPDFAAHNGALWEPQILQTLGLKSVLPAKAGERFNKLTLEQLYSYNPDVMFLATDTTPSTVDQWKSSPVWQKINAVKTKQVYMVSASLWSTERGIKTSEEVLQEAMNDLKGGAN